MKNLFKNKKWKYGSASVIFTAAVIALIVIINAVFTLLASNYHWYIDMTEERLYTVSDTSKELIGNLNFDGKLSMIFLQKKDKIEDAANRYTGDAYLKQIHELALDYAAEFPDLIELKYVDMYTEPGKLKTYTDQKLSMSPTSVIFDNNQGLFKVVGYNSFLAYDSSSGSSSSTPVGFYGEHKITATVCALCREKQTAYLTTGHGEAAAGEAFMTILESCGYNNVETVDLRSLTTEKLQEDKPRLVVVLDPKTDFVGTDGGALGNEISWLSMIVDGSYLPESDNSVLGSLMVFAEPGYELPNINSFALSWGLSLHTSSKDLVKESAANAFDNALLYKILPSYESDSTAIAYSLVRKLISRVAMNGAGTVTVYDNVSHNAGSVAVGSVLNLSPDATNDSEKYPAAGASVMGIAQNRTVVKSSYYNYNYVMLCADSSIISDEYLRSSSFGNEGLITNIVRATVDERETPEAIHIDYKDYVAETNVQGVSSATMKTFLIFMAAVIPGALLAAGIVVYVRRRNK